ncbi:MAG: hypothetical protein AAF611_06435 [Bacteroidota bacterium]
MHPQKLNNSPTHPLTYKNTNSKAIPKYQPTKNEAPSETSKNKYTNPHINK